MSDEQINDKLDRILEAMDGQHIVELKQMQVYHKQIVTLFPDCHHRQSPLALLYT